MYGLGLLQRKILHFSAVISVYAPTSCGGDSDMDKFYAKLKLLITSLTKNDIIRAE